MPRDVNEIKWLGKVEHFEDLLIDKLLVEKDFFAHILLTMFVAYVIGDKCMAITKRRDTRCNGFIAFNNFKLF